VIPSSLRPLAAEFVGTALFVFLGAGSVVMNAHTAGALGATGVALAHGVGLAIIVSMTMNISGGHINPAVTFALAATKRFPWREVPMYWASQVLGAILGAFGIWATFADRGRDLGYGFGVVNFANPDMVGHTGSIPAVTEAVETTDTCLGDVVAAVERAGGVSLVTAEPVSLAACRAQRYGKHSVHGLRHRAEVADHGYEPTGFGLPAEGVESFR